MMISEKNYLTLYWYYHIALVFNFFCLQLLKIYSIDLIFLAKFNRRLRSGAYTLRYVWVIHRKHLL